MSDLNKPVQPCSPAAAELPTTANSFTTAELLGAFRDELVDAGFDRHKAVEHALRWGIEMSQGSHCSLTVKALKPEVKA